MAEWAVDIEQERRREFHRALVASGIVHGVMLALLAWAPATSSRYVLPGVVVVDLVAAPRHMPPPAASRPKAKPRPLPPPEAAAPPKPKKVVLPKQATQPVEKAPTKPPPKAREQKEYDDVLAQLRADAGESRPDPRAEDRSEAAPAMAGEPGGVLVSPEVAQWIRDVRIHVRRGWVVPGHFRDQALVTRVRVEVDGGGRVIGTPSLTQSSGDPYWDDNVVRAVQKASPLPAPPTSVAGEWPFEFRSDEYF